MGIDRVPGQRLLLFYCLFTCIYFPGILILLKFNESLYNVGTYKFIPILMILMFAEVIKLLFSLLHREQSALGTIDMRSNSRSKKPWSKGAKECTKFVVAILLISIVYYIIIVLFGAPIVTHHEETTMLTVTLATLTFIPACLHLGVDTALAILTRAQVHGTGLIGEAVSLNIKATLLGAWLGAITIPLDWDRPWQAWPIPCVIGALVGYMTGHFVTLVKILPALRLHKKMQR